MSDNPDNEPNREDKQEISRKEVSGSVEATTSINAEITIGYSIRDIQERLEDGQIALALILTSTRIEQVLGDAIMERYDISYEQFQKLYGRRSLGRYQEMTAILDLFEQHQGTIGEIVSYRNDLVHFKPAGYVKQLDKKGAKREEVVETIEAAIEFIEETER